LQFPKHLPLILKIQVELFNRARQNDFRHRARFAVKENNMTMNMNKPPSSSNSSNVINAYRKRRQRKSINVVYLVAGLLILGGIGLLIFWLMQPDKPLGALFATETPTPTITLTPTSTSTPTETPTVTPTSTITSSPTADRPFFYIVQEGDSLAAIVEKNNLGDDGIKKIVALNPYDPTTGSGIDPTTQIIYPGLELLLPNPGYQLPTSTPIPDNLPRGTKLEYTIESGDTLAGIAAKFNSTEEEIINENKLTDPNAIFVGQILVIPVNLVTATATRPPTSTSAPALATVTLAGTPPPPSAATATP
jgi:LysM repeat protein